MSTPQTSDRIPDGTPVAFTHRGERMAGVVTESFGFNWETAYEIRTDNDWTYTAWSNTGDVQPIGKQGTAP